MSDQLLTTEEHLALQLAYADDRQYSNLAQYQSDVDSPLYDKSEAFRTLVEHRLRSSKHLFENSRHQVTTGGSVAVRIMEDGSGEVIHPGDLGGAKATPDKDLDHTPRVQQTGTSIIVTVIPEEEL